MSRTTRDERVSCARGWRTRRREEGCVLGQRGRDVRRVEEEDVNLLIQSGEEGGGEGSEDWVDGDLVARGRHEVRRGTTREGMSARKGRGIGTIRKNEQSCESQ